MIEYKENGATKLLAAPFHFYGFILSHGKNYYQTALYYYY